MEIFDKLFKEKSFLSFSEGPIALSTRLIQTDISLESARQELVEDKIFEGLRQKNEVHEISKSTDSSSQIANKPGGFDDDSFRNPQLYQIPFTSEQWEMSISLDARVFQLDKKNVWCDCLLDPDEVQFEKRILPRQLFEHLYELEVGRLIIIKIRCKKGSMRIDVADGRGIVSPELFILDEMWDSLKGF